MLLLFSKFKVLDLNLKLEENIRTFSLTCFVRTPHFDSFYSLLFIMNPRICLFTDLNSVRLPPPHVQFVVSHTECEDSFVDPQPRSEEDEIRRFRVDGFDHELSVVET